MTLELNKQTLQSKINQKSQQRALFHNKCYTNHHQNFSALGTFICFSFYSLVQDGQRTQ